MRYRYRSLTPPMITILMLSAGVGCDTEARREKLRVTEERARRQAETEPPTQEVLSQVREAVKQYMTLKRSGAEIENVTLTSLTPNLFLVGVTVKSAIGDPPYLMQLSAERLRNQEKSFFGGLKETSDLLWVVDELNAQKMKLLAQRHGLEGEVEALRREDPHRSYYHSWGHRSWLDDYLLWHYLYRRPAPMQGDPYGRWQQQPQGFRFHDPAGVPISPRDAQPYRRAMEHTGGRSSVFLGGNAWKPPLVSQFHGESGSAFKATRTGVKGMRSASGISRGGFGSGGRLGGRGFGG